MTDDPVQRDDSVQQFDPVQQFDLVQQDDQSVEEEMVFEEVHSADGDGPGILADDSMTEAGRKVLGYHLARMLSHEDGTRRGDPEQLHDMRVAIRRLRLGFRVFDGYLDDKPARVLRKELRRAGRVLGSVRDYDVFLARAEAFRGGLPEFQRADMDSLIAAVHSARGDARLLAYLDGKQYHRFLGAFEYLLDKQPRAPRYPRSGQPGTHLVSHVVPILVTTRIADIRAHEEWISGHDDPLDRLHRLRISLKRLRYTLEFFSEVLAPVTPALIEELKNEQDHLGALHDAHVAAGLIQRYLSTGALSGDNGAPGPLISATVTEFLSATHRDGHYYIEHFPDLWARLRSSDFRLGMLSAVEPLM